MHHEPIHGSATAGRRTRVAGPGVRPSPGGFLCVKIILHINSAHIHAIILQFAAAPKSKIYLACDNIISATELLCCAPIRS